MIAGGMVMFLLPFSRAVTLYQVENSLVSKFKNDTGGNYRGVWDTLKRTYKYEGYKGLWRGNLYNMLAACTGALLGIQCSSLLQLRENSIRKDEAKTETIARLLGMHPLYVVTTLLQCDFGVGPERRFGRGWEVIKQIKAVHALPGLYRGVLAYTMFDWVKLLTLKLQDMTDPDPTKETDPGLSNLASLTSLAVLYGLANPIDVVVGRLIVQQLRDPKDVQFKTFLQGWKYIVANEGYRALFRGTLWSIFFPLAYMTGFTAMIGIAAISEAL